MHACIHVHLVTTDNLPLLEEKKKLNALEQLETALLWKALLWLHSAQGCRNEESFGIQGFCFVVEGLGSTV